MVPGELSSWDLQEAGCAGIEVPLDGLDVPPPPGARGSEILGLGPAVFHVVVLHGARPSTASAVIAESLKLPQAFALQLLEFGAVHFAACPPLPRRGEAPPHVLEARALALEAAGNAAAFGKVQKVRRLREDAEVVPGGYLRVHARPKRFPACYVWEWGPRVVASSPDWVVLDKPPGVPVSPTVDNWRENCLVFGACAVGDAEPLLMTHRLDMVTSGVFVMGRTKNFVSYFNCLLQKGKAAARAPGDGPGLSKEYVALCASPPPLGRLVHHVSTNTEVKGSATYTEVVPPDAPGALRCELEVVSVAEVALGPRPDGADWDGWGATGFEARIRLFTGRTHQIRVQLAATGCPILGDCLYAPPGRVQPDSGQEPPAARKRAPRFRIGLQSAQLTIRDPGGSFFAGPEAIFEAGPPWWRKEGRDRRGRPGK